MAVLCNIYYFVPKYDNMCEKTNTIKNLVGFYMSLTCVVHPHFGDHWKKNPCLYVKSCFQLKPLAVGQVTNPCCFLRQQGLIRLAECPVCWDKN